MHILCTFLPPEARRYLVTYFYVYHTICTIFFFLHHTTVFILSVTEVSHEVHVLLEALVTWVWKIMTSIQFVFGMQLFS